MTDEIYKKLEEIIDQVIPKFKSYLKTLTIPNTWKKRMQSIDELDKEEEYKEITPNFLIKRKTYSIEWAAYGGDSELSYIMMGFNYEDHCNSRAREELIQLIVREYGVNINKINLRYRFSSPDKGVSQFLDNFINFILLKVKNNDLTEELKQKYIISLIDDFALNPKEYLSIHFIETLKGTEEKYNIYENVEFKRFDAKDFIDAINYNVFINPIKMEYSAYVIKFFGLYNNEKELNELEDDVLFILRLYKLSTIYFTERWFFKKSILTDNFFLSKRHHPVDIISMEIKETEKNSFEAFTNEIIAILRKLRKEPIWAFVEHLFESYSRATLNLDDYFHRIKYAVVGFDPIFRMNPEEGKMKKNITKRLEFLMSYFNYDIKDVKEKFDIAYSKIRSAKSHMGVIQHFTKEELKTILNFQLNILRKSAIVYLLNFKLTGKNFAQMIDETINNSDSRKEFDTFIKKILTKYESSLID